MWNLLLILGHQLSCIMSKWSSICHKYIKLLVKICTAMHISWQKAWCYAEEITKSNIQVASVPFNPLWSHIINFTNVNRLKSNKFTEKIVTHPVLAKFSYSVISYFSYNWRMCCHSLTRWSMWLDLKSNRKQWLWDEIFTETLKILYVL